jgi:hypothetical protein
MRTIKALQVRTTGSGAGKRLSRHLSESQIRQVFLVCRS